MTHNATHPARWLGTVAVGILVTATAHAATYTWNTGSGTWDTTTTANWAPATGVPANTDTALLSKPGAANVDVSFAATNLSGSGLAQLTLGNTGAGTNALLLDGTDALYTQRVTLNAGGKVAQTGGTLYLTLGNNNCVFNAGTYELTGGTLDLLTAANNHLDVRGGTMTENGGNLVAGWDVNVYRGAYDLSAGTCDPRGFHVWADNGFTATATVSGTGTLLANPGNESLFVGGTAGTSLFTQTGGTVNVNSAYGLGIRANGTYTCQGGVLLMSQLTTQDGGRFVYDANATTAVGFEIRVADNTAGGTGFLDMKQGTLSCRGLLLGVNWLGYGSFAAAGAATVNQTGGTIKTGGTTYGVYISHANATLNSQYNLQSGTISDSGLGAAPLTIQPRGTLRGYGTVDLHGIFTHNGKLIADGNGGDNILSILSYSALANSTDNTSDKGWYATNHGRLDLKPFAVSGTNTYYWGEQGNLDLVNAVRLAFTGASGTLTGRLYASDYSTVPSLGTYYRPLGVWEFSGPTFTSADLTFRLDDAQLATYYGYAGPAAPMQLLRYTGGAWQLVPGSLDWSTKTFTATGITGFSTFSLVALPEPGALTLAAAGLALALRRRRCR